MNCYQCLFKCFRYFLVMLNTLSHNTTRKSKQFLCESKNLGHRMKQHKAKLLYSEKFIDKHDAAKREREIKGWGREKPYFFIKIFLSNISVLYLLN